MRYDRGIRIWGAEGQDALEKASICLLHAGPTGAEALKNLVLGGIRSFCVVDAVAVRAEDLGNNFMISREALGRPRAEAVTGVCHGQAGTGARGLASLGLPAGPPRAQGVARAPACALGKTWGVWAVLFAAVTGAARGVLVWGRNLQGCRERGRSRCLTTGALPASRRPGLDRAPQRD